MPITSSIASRDAHRVSKEASGRSRENDLFYDLAVSHERQRCQFLSA